MYFGRYYRLVEEEELYRIATRSSSLRDVARELEMPWGTFHRYVSREENSGIRASIEEIIASNDERGIPEGYRIEDGHYVFEISSSDEPYRIHREVWEQVCSSYSRTGANMTRPRSPWSSISRGLSWTPVCLSTASTNLAPPTPMSTS